MLTFERCSPGNNGDMIMARNLAKLVDAAAIEISSVLLLVARLCSSKLTVLQSSVELWKRGNECAYVCAFVHACVRVCGGGGM